MIELTQNFCQSNKIKQNKLCVSFNFKHKSFAQMSKKVETAENLKLTILEEIVVIKGYQVCSFAVGVDEKFIVELGVQLIR